MNLQKVDNFILSEKGVNKIAIKEKDEYYLINQIEIYWVQSDGNYVKIKTLYKQFFIRHRLNKLLSKLDSKIFYQTHRSYIVNINKINKIKSHIYGNYIIELENGDNVPMTRNYNDLLQDIMKI